MPLLFFEGQRPHFCHKGIWPHIVLFFSWSPQGCFSMALSTFVYFLELVEFLRTVLGLLAKQYIRIIIHCHGWLQGVGYVSRTKRVQTLLGSQKNIGCLSSPDWASPHLSPPRWLQATSPRLTWYAVIPSPKMMGSFILIQPLPREIAREDAQLSLLVQGGGTGARKKLNRIPQRGFRLSPGLVWEWSKHEHKQILTHAYPGAAFLLLFACPHFLCLSLFHHSSLLIHLLPALPSDILEFVSSQIQNGIVG